jgi:hypothetical protein
MAVTTTETKRTGRSVTDRGSDADRATTSGPADPQPRQSRYIPLVCAPPRLPTNTLGKQLADRALPTGAGRWIFFAAVAVGISVAPHLPTQAGLVLDAMATFAASGWCLINFWRCREAHCVVSGYGWAALGLLEIVELALGRSVIRGDEGQVFVAILVVALVFECVWQSNSGSNALIRTASEATK